MVLRSLHKHIPALGRRDVQLSGIRTHYYPEGGWGWVVLACALAATSLSHGLQLAYGPATLRAVLRRWPASGNLVPASE